MVPSACLLSLLSESGGVCRQSGSTQSKSLIEKKDWKSKMYYQCKRKQVRAKRKN